MPCVCHKVGYDGRRNCNQGQTDEVSTIDMETIISRFYHIIQMIVTHSAIHLVRCCHGQMSLIAVSYPIIFIHDRTLKYVYDKVGKRILKPDNQQNHYNLLTLVVMGGK